jgi:hypothetical protein
MLFGQCLIAELAPAYPYLVGLGNEVMSHSKARCARRAAVAPRGRRLISWCGDLDRNRLRTRYRFNTKTPGGVTMLVNANVFSPSLI